MPNEMMQALALGPSPTVSGPGATPLSGAPSALSSESPQTDVAKEDASAALGDLAMAFKEATDPHEAADILVEFMTEAGFTRG